MHIALFIFYIDSTLGSDIYFLKSQWNHLKQMPFFTGSAQGAYEYPKQS